MKRRLRGAIGKMAVRRPRNLATSHVNPWDIPPKYPADLVIRMYGKNSAVNEIRSFNHRSDENDTSNNASAGPPQSGNDLASPSVHSQ